MLHSRHNNFFVTECTELDFGDNDDLQQDGGVENGMVLPLVVDMGEVGPNVVPAMVIYAAIGVKIIKQV